MTTPGCRKARDWSAQMFAGEMEPEARRELDTHLRACPACAAEEENIRRELSLLKTEDPPDPGVPYWSSFSGRLRTRIAAYQRRRRTLRLAALAAAAVLVAALALLRPRYEVPPRQIAEGPVVERTAPVAGEGQPALPAPEDVTARHPAAARPSPARVPSVAEAEAHLDALLRQAAAEGQAPRDLEVILDEVAPAHPLDGADALGQLSPDDGRSLSEDLLDTQG